MERSNIESRQFDDEFDYEPSQETKDMIALTDKLLAHKELNSPLSFVDIVAKLDVNEVHNRFLDSDLGDLLASDTEQLAIESDGSYYPKLDLQKQGLVPQSVAVRAWGWRDEKVRFSDDGHNYKVYDGEFDVRRELDVSFGYTIGGKSVIEKVSLYGSTANRGTSTINRSIYVAEYAETGYEGHNCVSRVVTAEEVKGFINLVSDIVSDTPESVWQYNLRLLGSIRQKVSEASGEEGLIDRLVETSWPAQAVYYLQSKPKSLAGNSLIDALVSEDLQAEATQVITRLIQRHTQN